MRHSKHKHLLGVKSAHRLSLMANMCCALIENGRIRTTLAKAKALRPSIEKIITLAKKAHLAEDPAKKVHYRRLAIARLRNKKSVQKLFDELAEDFVNRTGGSNIPAWPHQRHSGGSGLHAPQGLFRCLGAVY